MIRQAYNNDFDLQGLVELMRKFEIEGRFREKGLSFDAESFKKMIVKYIESPDRIVLVIEKDDKIVGGIAGFISTWGFNESIKISQELFYYVNRDYRGIESIRLLSLYERICGVLGVNIHMMVAVNTDMQDKVAKLYERKGYAELERTYYKKWKGSVEK